MLSLNNLLLYEYFPAELPGCFSTKKKLLPTYQVPNSIEIVDEIPKNGSGKKIRI